MSSPAISLTTCFRALSVVLLALFAAIVLDVPTSQAACSQPICVQNTARDMGNKRWDWTVFIDPQSHDLGQIKCVEYTLHPTFPDPVRTVCQLGRLEQPFSLRSNGWGTFQIRIRLLYRNGSIHQTSHTLRFQ